MTHTLKKTHVYIFFREFFLNSLYFFFEILKSLFIKYFIIIYTFICKKNKDKKSKFYFIKTRQWSSTAESRRQFLWPESNRFHLKKLDRQHGRGYDSR